MASVKLTARSDNPVSTAESDPGSSKAHAANGEQARREDDQKLFVSEDDSDLPLASRGSRFERDLDLAGASFSCIAKPRMFKKHLHTLNDTAKANQMASENLAKMPKNRNHLLLTPQTESRKRASSTASSSPANSTISQLASTAPTETLAIPDAASAVLKDGHAHKIDYEITSERWRGSSVLEEEGLPIDENMPFWKLCLPGAREHPSKKRKVDSSSLLSQNDSVQWSQAFKALLEQAEQRKDFGAGTNYSQISIAVYADFENQDEYERYIFSEHFKPHYIQLREAMTNLAKDSKTARSSVTSLVRYMLGKGSRNGSFEATTVSCLGHYADFVAKCMSALPILAINTRGGPFKDRMKDPLSLDKIWQIMKYLTKTKRDLLTSCPRKTTSKTTASLPCDLPKLLEQEAAAAAKKRVSGQPKAFRRLQTSEADAKVLVGADGEHKARLPERTFSTNHYDIPGIDGTYNTDREQEVDNSTTSNNRNSTTSCNTTSTDLENEPFVLAPSPNVGLLTGLLIEEQILGTNPLAQFHGLQGREQAVVKGDSEKDIVLEQDLATDVDTEATRSANAGRGPSEIHTRPEDRPFLDGSNTVTTTLPATLLENKTDSETALKADIKRPENAGLYEFRWMKWDEDTGFEIESEEEPPDNVLFLDRVSPEAGLASLRQRVTDLLHLPKYSRVMDNLWLVSDRQHMKPKMVKVVQNSWAKVIGIMQKSKPEDLEWRFWTNPA